MLKSLKKKKAQILTLSLQDLSQDAGLNLALEFFPIGKGNETTNWTGQVFLTASYWSTWYLSEQKLQKATLQASFDSDEWVIDHL